MKLETLVTRYRNLGYEPKGLDRDMEIDSIIKWLYNTHDIFVSVIYCSIPFEHHKMFTGSYIYNTNKDYHNTFYCDKHFVNPFDAKFDAVRHLYRGLKFNFYR